MSWGKVETLHIGDMAYDITQRQTSGAAFARRGQEAALALRQPGGHWQLAGKRITCTKFGAVIVVCRWWIMATGKDTTSGSRISQTSGKTSPMFAFF